MQKADTLLSTDLIREFVIAGHGHLEKVKKMIEKNPELLHASYAWSETDHETAIQGAAQVGSVPVAKYLLEMGEPLEICTAAMLGQRSEVERRIKDQPDKINQKEHTAFQSCPMQPGAATSNLSNIYSETEPKPDPLQLYTTPL